MYRYQEQERAESLLRVDPISELKELVASAPSGRAIYDECLGIARTLLKKNAAYGNSALDPVRVFSKASATEQLLVRLDDKLSRLQRGQEAGEDVILDLIGYLVLLRIAKRSEAVRD